MYMTLHPFPKLLAIWHLRPWGPARTPMHIPSASPVLPVPVGSEAGMWGPPPHSFYYVNISSSTISDSWSWCPATILGVQLWGWCDLWRLPLGNSFLISPVYWKLSLCDNKLLSLSQIQNIHSFKRGRIAYSYLRFTVHSRSSNWGSLHVLVSPPYLAMLHCLVLLCSCNFYILTQFNDIFEDQLAEYCSNPMGQICYILPPCLDLCILGF